ncbi:unnamed protein product [Ceratitis capitata]|uniref:(Mediterranean fruit fly) hypothetical protein n=1 Tax=Ceratitis capitata TaxID=7213 RepID=A0A811VJ44_CERCA|nr:unnamed protein product [Ceratitis capitata]
MPTTQPPSKPLQPLPTHAAKLPYLLTQTAAAPRASAIHTCCDGLCSQHTALRFGTAPPPIAWMASLAAAAGTDLRQTSREFVN